ncbi:MAG: tRNA (guanosine(46)-N7)-methyltransferase TrmB [Chlamydiales bacterium]
MKPKELKFPFSWRDRHTLVQDRVWYVPDYYDQHSLFKFPGFHNSDFFGNDNPVHIEYCSGNGAWIVEKAMQYPEINWLAVEKQFRRVKKIWSKVKNIHLKNVLIVCGEALTATKHYFPSHSIAEVYINFPDPWPKDRHAKHRLIQSPFVQQLSRILSFGGKATFVTDDVDYSKQMIDEMLCNSSFRSNYPSPHYTIDYPNYGSSFFDRLWRDKGRAIRYHQFEKVE